MKVLHVETGMNLYGGALQVFYLLRGLQEKGIENVLVCPRGSEIAQAATPFADVHPLTMRGELDFIFGHRLSQTIKRAARRTFCPFLPIASESWSSGTIISSSLASLST